MARLTSSPVTSLHVSGSGPQDLSIGIEVQVPGEAANER